MNFKIRSKNKIQLQHDTQKEHYQVFFKGDKELGTFCQPMSQQKHEM